MNPLKSIDNKKTYALVIFGLIGLGFAEGLGLFHMPDWVMPVLGLLGMGTIRHAISKGQKLAEQIQAESEQAKAEAAAARVNLDEMKSLLDKTK